MTQETEPMDANEIENEQETQFKSGLSATYSPEDNKLRLYATSRLSKELYARVKAAGFKWAPKQELFVCPRWNPQAEDLLLELCGEIDDEGKSATERSADRAERFNGYRDRRMSEATGRADQFDAGPAAFGHQNAARAERLATRHDRHRTHAVTQWRKAEYWQRRTAGVISHALHKESPSVRRGRILTLEADQRKMVASVEESRSRWEFWKKVAACDDAEMATKNARIYVGHYCGRGDIKHPRTGFESSAYSHMTNEADPMTGHEVAAALLEIYGDDPFGEETRPMRWLRHYEMRLQYERAMLENEGGMAGEAEMVPGGWFAGYQIQKVFRSPATKRVTSIEVFDKPRDGAKPRLRTVNIERMGADDYRAPTEEEKAAFETAKTERKAEEKAAGTGKPTLINPTDEDAERLQTLWNEKMRAAHAKAKAEHRTYGDFTPSAVARLTQAQYSANSKGDYARCQTVAIMQTGLQHRKYGDDVAPPAPVACSIRITDRSGFSYYGASSVIVLTDKPQKPLPIDWEGLEPKPQEPAEPVAAGALF